MRTSKNQNDTAGELQSGYDYDRQCWVEDYIVLPCGHPADMRPDCCFAGKNAGRDIRQLSEKNQEEKSGKLIRG